MNGEGSSSNRPFWLGVAAGWSAICFGLWTMFQHRSLTNPRYTFELAVSANIIHDAIFAPAAFIGAYMFRRVVPDRFHGPLLWALYTSVMVLLVAYAPLRGFGRRPDNPSLLPLDYATATLTVLGVVWAVSALLIIIRLFRHHRPSPRS